MVHKVGVSDLVYSVQTLSISHRYTRDPSQSPSPACTPANTPKSSALAETPISTRKTLTMRDNLPSYTSPITATAALPPHTPPRSKQRSSKLYPIASTENTTIMESSKSTTTDIPRMIPAGKDVLEFTRVFGSLLDPVKDRHRWKCHECQQVFIKVI